MDVRRFQGEVKAHKDISDGDKRFAVYCHDIAARQRHSAFKAFVHLSAVAAYNLAGANGSYAARILGLCFHEHSRGNALDNNA